MSMETETVIAAKRIPAMGAEQPNLAAYQPVARASH